MGTQSIKIFYYFLSSIRIFDGTLDTFRLIFLPVFFLKTPYLEAKLNDAHHSSPT